jgi:hypothetical protein
MECRTPHRFDRLFNLTMMLENILTGGNKRYMAYMIQTLLKPLKTGARTLRDILQAFQPGQEKGEIRRDIPAGTWHYLLGKTPV